MAFYDYWLDTIQDWWERITTARPKSGTAFTGEAMRIYVGNLSYAAKDEELTRLFAKFGKVLSVDIIRDRFSRKPKGYAFVEMAPNDGQRSLELNGIEFLGRKIVVSQAKSKERPQRGGERAERAERGERGERGGGGGGRGRRGGRDNKDRGERQQRQGQGGSQQDPSQQPGPNGEAPRRGKGPRIWKGRNKDLNLPRVQRYDD